MVNIMTLLKTLRVLLIALVFGVSVLAAQVETVKIAFMDPLSGLFANVG